MAMAANVIETEIAVMLMKMKATAISFHGNRARRVAPGKGEAMPARSMGVGSTRQLGGFAERRRNRTTSGAGRRTAGQALGRALHLRLLEP